MKIDLSGRIALVTGGSRGIGRECCLLLSQAGAYVMIHYNRSGDKAEELREQIRNLGCEADILQGDISRPEEIEKLFDSLRRKHDRLDILVNNAGIIKDSLLLSMKISDWDRVHHVNSRGAFLCSKLAVEMMMPNHCGKIINIASVSALRGGRGQTNYASAKGALVSFTRACAVELAGKNIQFNAVLPGMIVTEMSHRIRTTRGDKLIEKIPLSRFGNPSDVANLVVFLASDKADYITGQAICVDGGLSIS